MPAKKLNSKTSITKVAKPKARTLPKAKFKTTVRKKGNSVAATKKSVKATGMAAKPQGTDVFISYSHADKKWLTDVQTHLKPLGRDHGIEIWDDTRLQSGDKWRAEIAKALSKAKVAILLVSPRFMSSAFIATDDHLYYRRQKRRIELIIRRLKIWGSLTFLVLSIKRCNSDELLPTVTYVA